jgi:hypothetical protein
MTRRFATGHPVLAELDGLLAAGPPRGRLG